MRSHPVQRLSIYLGNADLAHHRSVSAEILRRAHHHGLAGVTTLHGVEGYGHSGRIHDTPTWALADRTPVTVHIIDTVERIRAFIPQIADLATQCLIVTDRVDVVVFPSPEPPPDSTNLVDPTDLDEDG